MQCWCYEFYEHYLESCILFLRLFISPNCLPVIPHLSLLHETISFVVVFVSFLVNSFNEKFHYLIYFYLFRFCSLFGLIVVFLPSLSPKESLVGFRLLIIVVDSCSLTDFQYFLGKLVFMQGPNVLSQCLGLYILFASHFNFLVTNWSGYFLFCHFFSVLMYIGIFKNWM